MAGPRLPSSIQQGQFGTVNPAARRRQKPTPIVLLKGAVQGREYTNDRGLDAIQQRVNDASGAARANPFASSNFFQNLTFVANTPYVLQHGLGRAFVSVLVMGQSVAGNYYVQRPSPVRRPATTQNNLDERQVTITPAFSGVADVVVI